MSMYHALHFDSNGVQRLSDDGRHEIHDLTPIAYPLNFRPGQSLSSRIHDMILAESRVDRRDDGFETFEDADDFDIGEQTPPFEDDKYTAELNASISRRAASLSKKKASEEASRLAAEASKKAEALASARKLVAESEAS